MVIVMKANATEQQISGVEKFLLNLKLGCIYLPVQKELSLV